jgi:thiol:disulfide interchange protein
MKRALLTSALFLFLASPFAINSAAAEPPKNSKVLYDTKADGNDQIKVALQKAQKENKNVILKFGANWCGWCHKLSSLFHDNTEISKVLEQNYIVVLIDVDAGHNADVVARYDNPTKHGLPVLVVLDKSGKKLHTQDTGLLEEGNHHDPAKVKAFLAKWKSAKA